VAAPPADVLAALPVLAVEPPDAEEPPDASFDSVVESLVLDSPPVPDCAPEEVPVDEVVSELSAVLPLAMLVVALPVVSCEPLLALVAVVSSSLVPALPSPPLPQLARPMNNETVTKFLIDMPRSVLPFARVNRSGADFVPGGWTNRCGSDSSIPGTSHAFFVREKQK
jgi:hypothetical protein